MPEGIKNKILELVKEYYYKTYKKLPYNKVPVSGKVYDEKELQNIVEAALEGWWTEGKWCSIFEEKLKNFLNIDFALLVNSGSSANFIAIKTLTSIKLGDRKIKPGDEVITVAAGFPTTVNPIIEVGAIPVFVDVELGTYNAIVEQIQEAVSPKTKAIFLAHTLGNPFDVKAIKEICEDYNLWLIEDNCDALGSKYDGRYTGTFGDLATLSFYPAHHITTAEGGAVLTNDPQLYRIARSIRDWGRDCWCPTGKDNTCGRRFSWQLGKLPYGYDHKYIYSEIGYNLKMTDLQAAIGVAQMDKLGYFIKKRKENFEYLYNKLKEFEDYFILPKATENSEPSWFGFLLTIKDSSNINRTKFMQYLNDNGIGTRLLFGGNLIKQPYFVDYGIKYKQIRNLENTDIVMNNTFWIGVYPALEKGHLDYVYEVFKKYLDGVE
ncbi:lipopolysaccharide biosynthesis protein RfbH [Methanocaldococcus villosus KIN24-T80]|uniref:Lipopolysaccharide biosynthesis protein RfbH n=1 Tax=Methanocaldococcus villosus KIN24-T80 TaxID=1069083 RepID=N6VRK5_9EURY|nr:lipopolysaccharide biosynthesis protein RfbH [Methanocaldococcus villosus]ENN95791.1 lipopolysaccharide biosynthesis protein RfbH [Methanocaldococcus villosus KIN24-T80]